MPGNARGALNDLPGLRPSRGIPKSEQEAERRLQGNNGPGHLSCVAALPFAYNGLGVRPAVAFFSLPSFPGKLLSLTKELLSPLHFFWPTFNPLSLLLFLPLVSVSPPKQNTVETMTIYSSHRGSALALRPLHVRLCAGVFAEKARRQS